MLRVVDIPSHMQDTAQQIVHNNIESYLRRRQLRELANVRRSLWVRSFAVATLRTDHVWAHPRADVNIDGAPQLEERWYSFCWRALGRAYAVGLLILWIMFAVTATITMPAHSLKSRCTTKRILAVLQAHREHDDCLALVKLLSMTAAQFGNRPCRLLCISAESFLLRDSVVQISKLMLKKK